MTVSSTTNRKEFTGDAVTTSFATSPVVFFDTGDLEVYVVTTATGAATLLTENTHYSVSGGDGSTGTVNLAGGASPYGAPAATQTLVIVRTLALTQETDFVQNDPSDAEIAEDALDRTTMVAQQLSARLDRSFTLADSDVSGASTELPTPAASTLLGWDPTGTTLANYTAAELPSDILVSAFAETLLDDTDAATARTTLDVSKTEPLDSVFRVVGSADATKKLAFEVDGLTTATTRTVTPPDYNLRLMSQTKGSDVASTDTVDLDAATGDLVDVTGTTTITAIALAEGKCATVRFTGALTLTHGASLVLPGSLNITTVTGDVAVFRGYAAGVVRCASYTPIILPPTRPVILGTVATTSGTSITLSAAIPSWAKRITLLFNGASSNGTSTWLVQIGPSGGVETSGYLGASFLQSTAPSSGQTAMTNGFPIYSGAGAQTLTGEMRITLAGSSLWIASATLLNNDASPEYTITSAGSKTITGALARIELTTVSGTDVFDLGAITVMAE